MKARARSERTSAARFRPTVHSTPAGIRPPDRRGTDGDLVKPLHIEAFTFPGFPDIEHRLPDLVPQFLHDLRGAAYDYLVAAEVAELQQVVQAVRSALARS